jgi:hypothetical protein
MHEPGRETVIVSRDDGGSGVIIALAVMIAVLVASYFLFFNNAPTASIGVPAVSFDAVSDAL